jgi:hypothetical protein
MALLSFSLKFTTNIAFICYFRCEVLELHKLLSGFAKISQIYFECNLFTIQDIHLHKEAHRFFFRHHEIQQFATEQYYCTNIKILTFEVHVSHGPFCMRCGVPQFKESRDMRGRAVP